MRAGTKRAAFHALAAAAALSLFPGCVIPGASFGTEPLQVRFADATRRTFDDDANPERRDALDPSQDLSILLVSE